MTVETLQADTGITTASFTVPYLALRNLLTGALVATGGKDCPIVLSAVLVEWDDDTVTATSTDRYRLATGSFRRPDGDPAYGSWSVLLPAAFVSAVVKALPKAYMGARTTGTSPCGSAAVAVAGGSVAVSWRSPDGEGSTSGDVLDAQFPKWQSLFPAEPVATGAIAFNPAYLADVAKLPHQKNDPARWTFHGSARPAVATYSEHEGVTWRYLLAPTRLAG